MGGLCIASALLLLLGLGGARAAEFNGFNDITGPLVKCHTTAANGQPFIIEARPDWAPLGAERFLKLVESGYFTGVPFFRVVPGFLTQFGITPDKTLRKYWREQGSILDDPNDHEHRPIKRGYLSFAGGGPNTRDFQFFIAYEDSEWLGKAPWEVPIGRVIYGMDEVIDKLYEVGEIHPFDAKGVKQGKIWEEGNDYLHREFPKLDYFTDCAVIGPSPTEEKPEAKAKEQQEQAVADKKAAVGEPKAKGGDASAAAAGSEKKQKKKKDKAAAAGGSESQASGASASSGRLAAAVEERISSGQRPEAAMWGMGTLCLIVGSIALFMVLLYTLGVDETAVAKGR